MRAEEGSRGTGGILSGVITVYLSLVTLLMISVIMASLESARTAVIKTGIAA